MRHSPGILLVKNWNANYCLTQFLVINVSFHFSRIGGNFDEQIGIPTTTTIINNFNSNAKPEITTTAKSLPPTTTLLSAEERVPKQINSLNSVSANSENDYFQEDYTDDLANAKDDLKTTTISVVKEEDEEPKECCACPGPTTTLSGMLTSTPEAEQTTSVLDKEEVTTTLEPTTSTVSEAEATTTTDLGTTEATTLNEDDVETTTLEMSTRGGRDFDGEDDLEATRLSRTLRGCGGSTNLTSRSSNSLLISWTAWTRTFYLSSWAPSSQSCHFSWRSRSTTSIWDRSLAMWCKQCKRPGFTYRVQLIWETWILLMSVRTSNKTTLYNFSS